MTKLGKLKQTALWPVKLRGLASKRLDVIRSVGKRLQFAFSKRTRTCGDWGGKDLGYQYVREPLTAEDADRLCSCCASLSEKLIVFPLLDCGLRISELCSLTPKAIQWQQRALRIKGKGGPFGKRSKSRVVPMSPRVRAIFEPYFAINETFPVGIRQAQKTVKGVADRARITASVTPHVLRHTFATMFIQKGGSIAALKKILGHDRLSTTEIYLNLTDRHVVEEYERTW